MYFRGLRAFRVPPSLIGPRCFVRSLLEADGMSVLPPRLYAAALSLSAFGRHG